MSEAEASSRGEPSALRSQIVDARNTNAASSSRASGGDNTDPAQLMCRRYMIGKCKKARKCPFSHSMDHLPTTFCRDYIFSELKLNFLKRFQNWGTFIALFYSSRVRDFRNCPLKAFYWTKNTFSEYCKYGSRCTKRHLNPKEENRREVLRKKYSKKKRMTWHDANEFEPGMPNHLERQALPPGVWFVILIMWNFIKTNYL